MATTDVATLQSQVATLQSQVASLQSALAAKADLVNGALDPAQMPTVNQVTFSDVTTSTPAQLTYNNGRFVRVSS